MAIIKRAAFLYVIAISMGIAVGFAVGSADIAVLAGSTLGTILNEKFLFAFVIPIVISLRFGFIYASLLCALAYTVILHTMLEEYWEQMGIFVSYEESFLKSLLGSSILYALINLVFDRNPRQSPQDNAK